MEQNEVYGDLVLDFLRNEAKAPRLEWLQDVATQRYTAAASTLLTIGPQAKLIAEQRVRTLERRIVCHLLCHYTDDALHQQARLPRYPTLASRAANRRNAKGPGRCADWPSLASA
jgi:hypothetical protein